MVDSELQKAKDLVKKLYSSKTMDFKEVAGIYHKNIDFITILSSDVKLRKFYLAVDKMYHKKNIEFELLNNNTQKADSGIQKQENAEANLFLQSIIENIDFEQDDENTDNDFLLQQIEKADFGIQKQENAEANLFLQQVSITSKTTDLEKTTQDFLF